MEADRSLILGLTLAYAAMLASCTPLPGASFGAIGCHELLVLAPQIPAAWSCLPDPTMALTWKGRDGRLRSALLRPGSGLRIEVKRGSPQAILALPSSAGRGLLPAGALYPEALAGLDGADELALDWLGGYAASIALALCDGGIDPWAYDLRALAEEAYARSGDPWFVPAREAARALSEGEFRIDAFKKPRLFALSLPGRGPWAPESPFAESPASKALLPEGLWRFVAAEDELFVSVDSEGAALYARRSASEGPYGDGRLAIAGP